MTDPQHPITPPQEPEGPTDEELLCIASKAIDGYGDGIEPGQYEEATECAAEVYGSELCDFARAVLARWGRLNISLTTMTEQQQLFRTSPPWKEAPTLPKGHEILAEFPAVLWGWECDMYYWIIRDPSSRVYVGATNHGRFYEAKPDRLARQINELNSYIEATQQALSMFRGKGEEVA